ncbi:MsnO8 family LLM class oxidoreductase [Patulibacter minatonensis]|uniref:MsnO8 family LLM class oxidoreductase n=1 Tax=Patulibacter minatonensis TaxID=298163 RepID=UPI00047B361F|nr:MsnO8 family LLM class oxidoreductase [Patulibacter minatonensis]
MLLSILDQAPTRRGGAPGHAFHDAIALARAADELGFHRFWVAEHHAIGSVAISAPEVLLGTLAGATSRIRVGSGGMLLPNHRPIHVVEQFRSLEALFPGRIDLGIGRSEGAIDDAIVRAFGRPVDNAHGAGFEEQLDELLAFGEVHPWPEGHPLATARAAPTDVPLPPVTLLGSSAGSAATAARKGLRYGFAAHTNTQGAADALRAYRENFVPARPGDRPHAMLAVKVMVGEDDEHARALAAPMHLGMAQARLGHHAALMSVEDALAHRWTAEERAAEEQHIDTRADVVGDPETVRAGLEAAVAASGADEVISISNTPDPVERRAAVARLSRVFALAAA